RDLRHPGRAGAAPGRAPLPARRVADRGRRAAVGDPGPVRRGLLLALQGQPAPADRLPAPVGVRARPVLTASLPGHDQLRPHQAALLHDPLAHQPEPDRPRRAADRLGRDPRRPPSLTEPVLYYTNRI